MISLYFRFKAEQMIIEISLTLLIANTALLIKLSQGKRSSSFNGIPLRIFKIFALGCKKSPSRNAASRLYETCLATADLPLPETPINTKTCLLFFVTVAPLSKYCYG